MATMHYSSGGFSYAQAAKGQTTAVTSQLPSSKVTSAATSPSNGILAEGAAKSSNWADDVEAVVGFKSSEAVQKPQPDGQQSPHTQEAPADRAKSDEKTTNGVSGISSPDLTATSSTTTKDEDSLSHPNNGSSSDGTWESRSQLSEPAWIQDRKERQGGGSRTREKSAKDETKANGNGDGNGAMAPPPPPPQKPVILQEALPPPVNPWLKRAEEQKAKATVLPRPAAPVAPASAPSIKENQRPARVDSRRKANSIASIPQESLPADPLPKKPEVTHDQLNNGVSGLDQKSNKVQLKDTDTFSSRAPNGVVSNSTPDVPIARQSLPNISTAPALAADESSWPTPDSTLEKDRKDSVEKDSDEKRDDEATPATRGKKREWKVLPVTPNFLFETTSMNEAKGKPRMAANGERGGKSGSGGRARGGHRGTLNNNVGDRQASRTGSSPVKRESDPSADVRGRASGSDQPSTTNPVRASSASEHPDRRTDFAADRDPASVSTTEAKAGEKNRPGLDKSDAGSGDGQNQVKQAFESRRTRSINQQGITSTDLADVDFIPKPIPRRSSSEAQAQRPSDSADSGQRPPLLVPRSIPTDNRKEGSTIDPSRDSGWPAPRSNKRGGRGRGGNGTREPTNGHQGNHAYHGNYAPDFGGPYGVQASPYAVPRGHHQYSYPPAGRGGWNNRGSLRSQSIPIENNYYQRLGYMPNGAPPQLSPINTYVPGMYDPSSVPMSAIPYPNQMDAQYLIDMVTTQLEYYFSVDNLLKDMFLRKHMDSKGFVLMDIVANFNRVKHLTQDKDVIKLACIHSEIIQIRVGDDGKERLRKADGWQQFLLPMEQREESAQNDGPEQLRQPDRPQLLPSSPLLQLRGPNSAGLPPTQHPRYDRRSYDSAYGMLNGTAGAYSAYGGIPEVMYGEPMNGEEMRGRAPRSPIRETPISPMGQPMDAAIHDLDNEPDAFQDGQVDVLTVVVKMSQQNQPAGQQPSHPYHSLSSRTFSNGSIDSRSIASEVDKPAEAAAATPKKEGQTTVNGGDMHLPPVPRRGSPNKPRSNDRSQKDSNLDVFWVKDQEGPVANLPSGLTSEPYVQLRLKALDQRNHAATGNCPYDMDVLYQFWCHFLIRNFNNRMYTEFKSYAHEDVKRTNYTGIQNLLKFYAQSLSSHNSIRDRVVKDYVELVQDEPAALQGAAFKQLRSAWRNGALNLKNRKKLADIVDEKLKEQLDRLEA